MRPLLKKVSGTSSFKKVFESLGRGHAYVAGAGLSEKVLLAACAAEISGGRCVYIARDELSAVKVYREFFNYFPDDTIYLPPKELLLYSVEARSHDNEYRRICTISRILGRGYRVLVLPVRALVDVMCSPRAIAAGAISLRKGMEISSGGLGMKISEAGYKRESLVEGKGQFSIRGGIFDVFPTNSDNPLRIEFFGDEIESIRYFDPASQRSLDDMEMADILPAREVILDGAQKLKLAAKIRDELDSVGTEAADKLREDIELLEQGMYVNGMDKYINFMSGDERSILGYIDPEYICIDDIDRFDENYGSIVGETNEEIRSLLENRKISSGMADLVNDITFTRMQFDRFSALVFSNIEKKQFGEAEYIYSRPIPAYKGDLKLLRQDIQKWEEDGYSVYVAASSAERGERIRQMLDEQDTARILEGSIENGFELQDCRLAVLSEKTIFNYDRKKHEHGYKGRKTKKLTSFSDIRKNDLVVHRVHGIGIYEGIEQLTVEKVKRDYIKILYRDGGTLYIPTDQLDAVQKYIGADDRKPRINKLGTGEWNRTKAKVRESLAKLAEDLVALYAMRQSISGHRYPEDTPWQMEFEEKFPYEETEDQLTCTDEIKKDMQGEAPMDRILCGDVGYGKTEVAVRAMFKAVSDDRQVAYLVPTTVLAQQQYGNFIERFADYPVKIEMLSRFRTHAQQKEIVEKTKKGHVDILIATHRLLSRDISFKDLGLLVVDEEHRFGVGHKERIKEKYPDIDVLTLTATPIPRTLHMSMVGIRDISVINMPPRERYPVQTYVIEYDEDILRNAVYREMARGGQVFYIHNRVRDIDLVRDRLHKMVPEAEIGISHGQMSERELEKVMEAFVNREFDLLLCTTIIESGLDISNANTIIVEDSENFGLAQLYQLKGRVGRSDRHAYAYITYRKDKVLNENAEKRLNALREFTEFGAGFKIALRDLEIRGAGNLLGPEQHGQMDAVGYDTYCRLLEEAISDARGMAVREEEPETVLEVSVSAYIDDLYIPDVEQKIEMYKRIADICSEEDMKDVEEELGDRYGEVPAETLDLVMISYLKHLARELGFICVKQGRGEIILRYRDKSEADPAVIVKLGEQYEGKILFTPSSNPYLTFKCRDLDDKNVLENIKVILHLYNKLKYNK